MLLLYMPSVDMSGDSHALPETYASIEQDVFFVSFDSEEDTETSDGGTIGEAGLNFEPLQQSGGLEHNQVVEILGWELEISATLESPGPSSDFGNDLPEQFSEAPGTVGARYYFGANLSFGDLAQGIESPGSDFVRQLDRGSPVGAQGKVADEVAVFDYGLHTTGTGHLREANKVLDTDPGAFASASNDGPNVKHNRLIYPVDMGIRGPVLDENDDLSVIMSINKEDTSRSVEYEIVGQIWYNIMEIEGVRNDFDMPDA